MENKDVLCIGIYEKSSKVMIWNKNIDISFSSFFSKVIFDSTLTESTFKIVFLSF